jgi:hypothetical protein
VEESKIAQTPFRPREKIVGTEGRESDVHTPKTEETSDSSKLEDS